MRSKIKDQEEHRAIRIGQLVLLGNVPKGSSEIRPQAECEHLPGVIVEHLPGVGGRHL